MKKIRRKERREWWILSEILRGSRQGAIMGQLLRPGWRQVGPGEQGESRVHTPVSSVWSCSNLVQSSGQPTRESCFSGLGGERPSIASSPKHKTVHSVGRVNLLNQGTTPQELKRRDRRNNHSFNEILYLSSPEVHLRCHLSRDLVGAGFSGPDLRKTSFSFFFPMLTGAKVHFLWCSLPSLL